MFTRHFSTLRCTVHSGKCSKSSHIDCTRETAYGVTGTDASLCAVHSLIGMIKLNSLSESCVEKSKKLEKTSALLKEQQKTPEQFRLKVCRSQSEKCCPKNLTQKPRDLLSFQHVGPDLDSRSDVEADGSWMHMHVPEMGSCVRWHLYVFDPGLLENNGRVYSKGGWHPLWWRCKTPVHLT